MAIKRLDYIHSEGNSWIDSGIKCKSSLRIQTKMKLAGDGMFMEGARWVREDECFRLWLSGNSGLDWGSGAGFNRVTGSPYPVNQEFEIEMGNRYSKNLQTGTYYINASPVAAFEKTYNLYIAFDAWDYQEGLPQNVHASFYYVKIFDGDTPLVELYPAKNDEGEIGMYDVLSGTFYANQGTQPFTYGQEVGGFGLKPENFYNLAMTANDYTDSDLNRFIVSASSILDAPRQPYRAFDGNYDTLSEWHPTSGVPQWLKMQVEKPVKVLGFRIYSRPGYVEQPTAFKLQGSNDGETWTDLESYTWTETSTSGVHYKDCVVPDNGQFYTYFRWYMTDAVSYSPYCCVNEITFTNVVVFSPISIKYVFESDSKFYTVVDDAFSEITDVTELTASVFETYGVDEIPDETLLLTLDDVTIHMWTNTDEEVSKKATMEAIPYPQTLISPNYDMSHPSILGIESAEAVASEDVTIAVSFDDGETWKMYDGSQWITLNVETAGMSAATLNAISTESWNSVAITGMFKFRITIPDETESFTSLVVDYLQN